MADAEQIELQGRRVAVTGANGFIGAAVCRALAAEGAEVLGVEVSSEHEAECAPAASSGSPTSPTARRPRPRSRTRNWSSIPPRTCAMGRDGGLPAGQRRGHRQRLDAAEAAAAERVVHVSSVVVYGYEDESHQGEGAFRRAGRCPLRRHQERLGRMAARRGAVIVRPGDVYGPGSIPWLVRPVELMASKRIALPGKGDGAMLPAYIDDLVAAILLALRRGEPGRSYTVWDGHGVSFAEYYGLLAASLDFSEPPKLPKPLLFAAGAATEAYARLRGGAPLVWAPRPHLARSPWHRLKRAGARGARLVAVGRAARGNPPQRRMDPCRGIL